LTLSISWNSVCITTTLRFIAFIENKAYKF
jgi:hypothetical protein